MNCGIIALRSFHFTLVWSEPNRFSRLRKSPEFIGRVIGALNVDTQLMRRSGQVVVAAQLAEEFGVVDVDGKQPTPLTLDTV